MIAATTRVGTSLPLERVECGPCNSGEHSDCARPARCPCWCSPRNGRTCAAIGGGQCDCFPKPKQTEYAAA